MLIPHPKPTNPSTVLSTPILNPLHKRSQVSMYNCPNFLASSMFPPIKPGRGWHTDTLELYLYRRSDIKRQVQIINKAIYNNIKIERADWTKISSRHDKSTGTNIMSRIYALSTHRLLRVNSSCEVPCRICNRSSRDTNVYCWACQTGKTLYIYTMHEVQTLQFGCHYRHDHWLNITLAAAYGPHPIADMLAEDIIGPKLPKSKHATYRRT